MGTPDKPERELTPKQEAFCQAYTTHWNATKAAKVAGYSEKSAGLQGHQLLKNPIVQARIAELGEHALREMGVTRERVLQEYARLAFYDMGDAHDEIGQLRPLKEMPEDVRRAVVKVKVFEQFSGSGDDRELTGFIKEIEFAQRKAALDSLSKCLGMAPDKVEHSGPGGKPIETKAIKDLTDEQLEEQIARHLSKDVPS